MAQHMEKGMRGQLVVGAGSGDLWGVPQVSDAFLRSDYWPQKWILWGGAGLIFFVSLFAAWRLALFEKWH